MTLFALSNLVYLSALLNNKPCKIWKPIEISMLHKGNFERSHVTNSAFKTQWGYFFIISIMISFNHPNPKAENKIISAEKKNIKQLSTGRKCPPSQQTLKRARHCTAYHIAFHSPHSAHSKSTKATTENYCPSGRRFICRIYILYSVRLHRSVALFRPYTRSR